MLLQHRRIQKEVRDYRDRLEELIAERTAQLADEIEVRKQAHEAVKAERERLRHALDLQETERRLIAYEIHDGLAQQLAGASMQIQALRAMVGNASSETSRAFDTVQRLLEDSLREARGLINGLRPPSLDEYGVEAAIEELISRKGLGQEVQIEFQCELGCGRMAAALENAVFRIVQEGINNARRHSRSDWIRVALSARNGCVRIEIQDRGIGFDPSTVNEGRFGLQGIRERARLFGGQAVVESGPGKGARILVTLPVTPASGG
ncbi:MAG: sensor histidine kinase [Pirellulales bacterium]|nr:sensor histidine kinase [Pirellulales bacterium]